MTIEGPLTNIAKPAIVELLRVFDENQWVVPRIRYASVRSKPELIEDIQRHFRASLTNDRFICFRTTASFARWSGFLQSGSTWLGAAGLFGASSCLRSGFGRNFLAFEFFGSAAL